MKTWHPGPVWDCTAFFGKHRRGSMGGGLLVHHRFGSLLPTKEYVSLPSHALVV